jgi:hypothetical protein
VKKPSARTCVPTKADAKYRKATMAGLVKSYTKYKMVDKLQFMPIQIEQLLQVPP